MTGTTSTRSGSTAQVSHLWTHNGVPVAVIQGNQLSVQMVADGDGGAILSWDDFRSWTTNDVYAQGIDALGRQ